MVVVNIREDEEGVEEKREIESDDQSDEEVEESDSEAPREDFTEERRNLNSEIEISDLEDEEKMIEEAMAKIDDDWDEPTIDKDFQGFGEDSSGPEEESHAVFPEKREDIPTNLYEKLQEDTPSIKLSNCKPEKVAISSTSLLKAEEYEEPQFGIGEKSQGNGGPTPETPMSLMPEPESYPSYEIVEKIKNAGGSLALEELIRRFQGRMDKDRVMEEVRHAFRI